MRFYLNKKVGIVITIIAGVLLIIAIFAVLLNKDTDGNDIVEDKIVDESYDILGKWYSDKSSGDIITLYEDGTYTSSAWLLKGTYTVEDNKVMLLENLSGSIKELTIRPESDTLLFDNAEYSHTYYRTQEAIPTNNNITPGDGLTSIPKAIITSNDMQAYYNAAISQILTLGKWLNSRGDTSLTFTETEYTARYEDRSLSDNVITTTESYAINSFEVISTGYIVYYTRTDENGAEWKNCSLTILYKGDSNYSLQGSSLPFSKAYAAVIDFEFLPYEDVLSGAGMTTEDSSIGTNDDAEANAQIAAIEYGLLGTWIGSIDDQSWTYELREDSTFVFSDANGSYTGSYTLTHDLNTEYHTTITLNYNDESRSFNFKITSGENEPSLMYINNDTSPVYTKQP